MATSSKSAGGCPLYKRPSEVSSPLSSNQQQSFEIVRVRIGQNNVSQYFAVRNVAAILDAAWDILSSASLTNVQRRDNVFGWV